MVGGFRAARTLEGWSTAALALVVWCVVSAVFVIFQAATPVAAVVVVRLLRRFVAWVVGWVERLTDPLVARIARP